MKIALLLSGGVDSSVALRLLQEQGHADITAFYLKIWLEDELAFLGECPWEEDLQYARSVCEQAGVKLEVVSLQREYHERVVSYTVKELKAGRTPSPDIFCNQRIKFGAFFERLEQGYDKVATGHYARLREADGEYRLYKGVDPVKDQTYFLSHLSQEQLSKILFPVGELSKAEVRHAAKKFDLPTQSRRDSQGICFLGKIRYNDFVKFHLGEKEGPIVDLESGKQLGKHQGVWFHTIGQRKGLGLSQGPWFVVRKDLESNTVFVSHLMQVEENSRSSYDVSKVHWIHPVDSYEGLTVKLRHSPTVFACGIEEVGKDKLRISLAEQDNGVASGQFTVFYKEDECLGGAVIE